MEKEPASASSSLSMTAAAILPASAGGQAPFPGGLGPLGGGGLRALGYGLGNWGGRGFAPCPTVIGARGASRALSHCQ
jgi:hypothetical protein